MKKPLLLVLLFAACACLVGIGYGVWSLERALHPPRSDTPLAPAQTAAVRDALALMQARGLTDDAAFGQSLLNTGKWRAAASTDAYIAAAERSGDTPYAYTLADGKHILAVVLAPRFFTEATSTGRAALMIHEMGHCRAYLQTGRSTEYDGYKREYDTHAQLGLTERDGLVYWSMLDGVMEYVLPRAPAYKSRPDMRDYIQQATN